MKNYYQKQHDAQNGKLQQGNYASTSNQGDEQLFVMQHMANLMIGGVSDNNVWYVDFGASNHMTSHGEWFKNTQDLKTPWFVEISDDTTHPITQIGKVPLSMQDGQTKYLKNVLRVPRNGRMFTLDVNMPEVNSMLFTHEKGAGNIGIWHKRVGHVNLQCLQLMEKQNLVGGLPKFGTTEVMSKVCEACQLGK